MFLWLYLIPPKFFVITYFLHPILKRNTSESSQISRSDDIILHLILMWNLTSQNLVICTIYKDGMYRHHWPHGIYIISLCDIILAITFTSKVLSSKPMCLLAYICRISIKKKRKNRQVVWIPMMLVVSKLDVK